MSEIGILGGTFDPFHFGHLSIAEAAIKEFDLSEVILLPTKVQPFKIGREMASEEDRVNMVRLIAKENKQFRVSTIEAYGQRVSYTYKTLKLLQKEYPDDKFYPGHRFLFDLRRMVQRERTAAGICFHHRRQTGIQDKRNGRHGETSQREI